SQTILYGRLGPVKASCRTRTNIWIRAITRSSLGGNSSATEGDLCSKAAITGEPRVDGCTAGFPSGRNGRETPIMTTTLILHQVFLLSIAAGAIVASVR